MTTGSGTWDPEAGGPGSTFSTLPPAEEGAGEPVAAAIAGPDRYEWLGKLGMGGMGEVWRVRDRELARVVAMKVLRRPLLANPRSLVRFREEAKVAAQLQHPGIVPVHDIGRLPDGRVFFTMKEVRGRTLEAVGADVHRGGARAAAIAFRRVADAFLRVCEAVAYAHHRGVVHRDLKPANVMIGDFGEVLVLDWGLARVLSEAEEPVETARSEPEGALSTRVGAVTGTPAYMAPEQARGESDRIGPATDVYALGATLFELLTGRAPYEGDADAVVARVASGSALAAPSSVAGAFPIPDELDRICLQATAVAPEDRFADAGALADAFAAWLDGARKRERALTLVGEAAASAARAEAHEARAEALRRDARERLAAVPAAAPEEEKWPGWDLEDQARAEDLHAERARLAALQALQAALSHDPDCIEAHEALADDYVRQHAALEARGRRDEAARLEPWLRAHDRGRHAAYLRGDGAVTLVTDPEGAAVDLYRFVLQRRRLVPVFERSLGVTPLREVPLPMGSYLLVIRAKDRAEVRYPVLVGRREHWDGVPPGETEPFPIRLPLASELGPDDVYVPAGWFWCGGELEQLTDPVPFRRVWAHPFVIAKHPVTNAEYVAFLNDLLAQGRAEEAARFVPVAQRAGAPTGIVRQGDAYALGVDESGSAWLPRVPVVNVPWEHARAHAAWRSARDGLPWRLPFELEWEKAARGVDGRVYPFGSELDPAWCRTKASWTDQPGPVAVDAHPQDVSVYGARGMTGNVAQWTLDPRPGGSAVQGGRIDLRFEEAAMRRCRGGSWSHNSWFCRVDVRKMVLAKLGADSIGFRILRSA
jgi:formylglycine-generating enzyme required for sulfatase activity/tRNA A-37 threonylcarbamoyl transferase component Bud32